MNIKEKREEKKLKGTIREPKFSIEKDEIAKG